MVAEKYAAEIEAVGDEPSDLKHVLARDSEYESSDMRRERIACMFMVPMILNAINRTPRHRVRRVPDLKCMLVSAVPISDETVLNPWENLQRRHV